MKAIVYTKYGPPDVLRLAEVEKPVPGDDDVLVKIRAASLNAADWHLLRADPFLARFYSGLLKPKHRILGADIAGRVEAVGKNVKQFKPGDEVFGDLFTCGLGGFAEYACAREDALVLKPAAISFEQAAGVPVAGGTALRALRGKGKFRPGQKVLINGASGGVGTFAVQIAKTFGAEVTAVCSAGNVDMARSIGADHVIDYAREDFTGTGRQYDLIIGANGFHPIMHYKRTLNPGGIYVMTGGSGAQMFEAMAMGPFISMTGSRKLGGLSSSPTNKDLVFLEELLETRRIKTIIDRRYPLSETAEAFRYLEHGHAKGKILISLE